MVLAVAKALEEGARSVICASTGNTSASAAAYAAAAGLECVVVLPAGKIAVGKLLQALVFGRAGHRGRRQLRRRRCAVVRALAEQDEPPDHARQLRQPVPDRGPEDGGVRGVRRPRPGARRARDPGRQRRQHHRLLAGFREYRDAGSSTACPRMCGLPGGRRGADRRRAAGRRSPRPSRPRSGSATRPRGRSPIAARDESGGRIDAVTDDGDPRRLPRPRAAGGRVLRAVVRRVGRGRRARPPRAGELDADATVVCVLTGNGLKDPTTAEAGVARRRSSRPTPPSPTSAGRSAGGEPGARGEPAGPASSGGGHRRGARRRRPTSARATTASGSRSTSSNRVDVEARRRTTARSSSTVAGEGAGELPADRSNRFVARPRGGAGARRSGRGPPARLADRDGQRDPAVARPRLVGRGDRRPGVVGGDALASAARRLDDDLLRLATAIEGHPDNVAAALLGGFVVVGAARGSGSRRSGSTPRGPAVRAVHPGSAPGDEDDARRAAGEVPLRRCRREPRARGHRRRRDRQRAGIELLADLTQDRLHEPYRSDAYPELPRLTAGRARGRRDRRLPVRAPARRSSRSSRRGRRGPGRGGAPRRGRRVRPGRADRGRRAPEPRGARRRLSAATAGRGPTSRRPSSPAGRSRSRVQGHRWRSGPHR